MNLNTFWSKIAREAPNDQGAVVPDPQANADPAPQEDPAAGQSTADQGPDLGWLPEEYRKDGQTDLDGFKAHYEELIADKARREDEATKVPEKYDFALPDDFDLGVELPEGVQIELDTDNPLFGDFGEFLKENQISQPVAQGLVGLLAKYQAQQTAAQYTAATKEFETLGATESARNARVSTVQRALETKLPADQAGALMAAVTSAAGVKALETILKPRGATPSPTPQGADTSDLTPYQRLQRARAQA